MQYCKFYVFRTVHFLTFRISKTQQNALNKIQ